MADPPAERRSLHGRRHGKALRPAQRRRLATMLPALAVPEADARANPARRAIDPAALFPGARAVWLEIGFGGGEHLVAQAMAHPDVGLIGCEAFVNGVAMLFGRIEATRVGNIRVHAGDARDLIEVLPAASIGRAFLLYPDPWPKARHRKRRFVNPGSLLPLARVLAPGAAFRIATDIADYAEHAVEGAAATGLLAPVVAGPPDWHAPWDDWPGTRYEAKALRAGRRPHYLTFQRR